MKMNFDINELDKLTFVLQKKLFAQITEGIDLPVTSTHLYMLNYIRSQGECMATGIANYLGVTLGAVTSLVDRLYDFGFVSRDRSEVDRRQVVIKLSEGGQEFLRKIDARRKLVLESCFEGMDQGEITYLRSIMEKVFARLLES